MAEKAKKLCYERRAACIMKKAMELQILCGLKVGVVILSPDGKLESWPPELNDVKALLDACKEMGPRVKSEKRKDQAAETSSHSCREILVSKLQLLKQREELFKGKEIATASRGGETLVRSKKRKDFGEQGCLEILNSKLQLLKKREMVFLNRSGNSEASAEGKEIFSMEEGIESLCDGILLTQNLYDDLHLGGKGKGIATMDSGILQHTAHLGPCQCDENGELTIMNNRMSSKNGLEPNEWHHGSSRVNSTLQAGSDRFGAFYPPQNSFSDLGNRLPPTTAEECGELQVRKKIRLQYPTAALNNNLPQFTPEEYWETMFTNVVNSTDVMLSLLEDL